MDIFPVPGRECLVLKALLTERLSKDPRHKNIKLFETKEIEQRTFGDWSMKYISKRSSIQQFCQEMGFEFLRLMILTRNK